MPTAKIIADSVTEEGYRLTSFEVRMHRFVLAEFNTHRLFARNSASSRAIPLERTLTAYSSEPAFPFSWPAEQPGMQGGDELKGRDLDEAVELWRHMHLITASAVRRYADRLDLRYGDQAKKHRLHKSVLNRLLEPMQWHTVLVTSWDYENFFQQRCSEAAQPEIRHIAEHMRNLYELSEPRLLHRGEWHLPYVDEGEELHGLDAREVSTARCARTSYGRQGERNPVDDVRMYREKLLTFGHMSPFEHVATPWPVNVEEVWIDDPDHDNMVIDCVKGPRVGAFAGWQTWRTVVEARYGRD